MNTRTVSILLFCWVLLAHVPLFAQRLQPATIDECELRRNIIYPDEAEQRGVEGDVELRVKVNADGHARDAEIVSTSDQSLGAAAREGVLRARFRPAMLAEYSVLWTITLKIRFVMAPVGEVEGQYDAVIRAGFGKVFDPASDTIRPVVSIQDSLVNTRSVETPDFDIQALYCFLQYPEMARRNNIEGKVIVRVFIDRFGRPTKVLVEYSSNSVFDKSAINALRKIRYRPAMMDGKPLGIWIEVPLHFRLRD